MLSYFAKILKSSEYQGVLKVYYLTKNRQIRAKSSNIRKLQITDYQYNIFFWFLLFSRHCTGSGYYKSLVNCSLQGIFLFQYVLKVYYITMLWEKCTFMFFRHLDLYLINDNSSLLFRLFPSLGFFSNEYPIFVNSTHHRKLQNGKWQSKDTAWQYSTNIKLLLYSDLQCAHWKHSEEGHIFPFAHFNNHPPVIG